MSLKAEFYRVFKSTRCRIFLMLFFLIPFLDLLLNFYQNALPAIHGVSGETRNSMIFHPVMASFLSGTSHGHITQMLLIWLLPIYILLIYGDSYIQEKKCGYSKIVFSQCGRREVIRNKLGTSFLLFFGVVLLSLLLNFILAHVFFMNGSNFKGMDRMVSDGSLSAWHIWSLENPYAAYLLCMFVYSLLSGVLGMVCCGVSFLAPIYKLAYPVCFFLWFIQIMYKYSITYAFQPFIEYGPDYFVPALLVFFLVAAFFVAAGSWCEVRRDEY